MAAVELLKHNLAIEPDLQNFLHFILAAVRSLGGNPFAAASATVNLVRRLRADGAGSGCPLPVRLVLEGACLQAEWGEQSNRQVIDMLKATPAEQIIERLRHEFQQSTEAVDPTILFKRNAEMTRYLDETRKRTEKEIALMQRTLAARQEELRESLRQAESDPLTGLYNRRAFDERLGQAFRRVQRQSNEYLALALLDLDFFKQINDEHGHQFGDAYLNKAAQAMLDAIRADVDMVFRIGGDEFAMLLFADGETGCRCAMDVLAAMKGKVSIGIATMSSDTHNFQKIEDFIRSADEALYHAKRSGRGRVVVSGCRKEGFVGCEEYCIETTRNAKRA